MRFPDGTSTPNVRPVSSARCHGYGPLKERSRQKMWDFVVIRENTEGVLPTDAGGVFKQGTPDEIAIQGKTSTRAQKV